MRVDQPKLPRQVRQAVAGQHDPRQVERIEQDILRLRVAVDEERQVEVAAVRDHPTGADEVDQLRQDLFWVGRRGDIGIADPGELLDRARNADFRADERLKGCEHLVALEPNRPDLDDAIEPRTEAGSLEIESNERAIHYRNALKSGHRLPQFGRKLREF